MIVTAANVTATDIKMYFKPLTALQFVKWMIFVAKAISIFIKPLYSSKIDHNYLLNERILLVLESCRPVA